MKDSVRATPAASSAVVMRVQSATFIGDEPHQPPVAAFVSHIATARSDSGNGSGRRRMLSTTAKMDVVDPTASAIVATAAAVNVGDLRSVRNANRMSPSTVLNMAGLPGEWWYSNRQAACHQN